MIDGNRRAIALDELFLEGLHTMLGKLVYERRCVDHTRVLVVAIKTVAVLAATFLGTVHPTVVATVRTKLSICGLFVSLILKLLYLVRLRRHSPPCSIVARAPPRSTVGESKQMRIPFAANMPI